MQIIITNGKIKIDDKELPRVIDYSISSKFGNVFEPVVLSINLDITHEDLCIKPKKFNTVKPVI